MELAEFHAVIVIRKLFGLSICFVYFLGHYPKHYQKLAPLGTLGNKKGQ